MNIPQDPTIVSQEGLFDEYDDSQGSETEEEEDSEPDWMRKFTVSFLSAFPLKTGLVLLLFLSFSVWPSLKTPARMEEHACSVRQY